MPTYRSHVLVCGGTGCVAGGSQVVQARMKEELAKKGLDKEVLVVQTGCHGMCEAGPIVVVYPEGTFYTRVQPDDAREIVEEHLYKGRVVSRLLYTPSEKMESVKHYNELPFYAKQQRIALRNCGYINPDNIE